MRPRKIPVYPIADYSDGMTRDTGIFVGTIEESIAQRPKRLAIHRHDYFELYLLEGEGEHFNDFETYAIETPSIVCVSPGQVHFWKQAGTFIRQRILLEAQRLLLHTSLTVSEVAYGVGFEDPSYFIRFFRRLTGKTPSAFRDHCHLKYSA